MGKKLTKKATRTLKKLTRNTKTWVNSNTITVKNAEGSPDTITTISIQNKINYTPKVSIVIPVYNVEEYLRECLDSVTKQTLKEIEIICVDDGSTDGSLEILKEYAKKDRRITLVAPEHIGTGYCRNIALSLVKGEYIGFIDPDDWIEKEYFEKLYNASLEEKPDIVFQTSRIETYYKTGEQVVIDTPKATNEYAFRFNAINYSAHLWSKIFKRSFIEKHNLKNSFTRRSQDLLFTFPALLLAKNIKCINDAKYYYRKGQKSACTVEYTEQDANEVFALYSQIEHKISQFDENMLAFVKYKKNLTLMKMYFSSPKEVKDIIRTNAKDLYEIDFDLYEDNKEKISIKNPAPDNVDKLWWGDYWLGLDLAQGLKERGYGVKTNYTGNKSNTDSKINIVVHGIQKDVKLDRNNINILYIISHPDDIVIREAKKYNFVIVGSKKKCAYLQKHGVKSYYLPQFTNPRRFFYEKNKDFANRLLFVGNAYGGLRPSVEYATKNNLPISVYGKFWEKFINKKYIHGEYIDNNDLHKYYSNAEIVLNDTNENMRSQGFVSNRIYDVTACKAFVISDYMPEIESIYGDAIPMYKNEEEFVQLVNYYLKHPKERREKAEKAHNITMKTYTNIVFAENLQSVLKHYSSFSKHIRVLSAYVLFPYNLLKLFFLKRVLARATKKKKDIPQKKASVQEINKDEEIKKIIETLMSVRIDIKNCGGKTNNLIIEGETKKTSTPAYYTDDKGIGYVLEYNKTSNRFTIKVVNDGKLQIKFKSKDTRFDGQKYPLYINYNSIKIDKKEILSEPVSVCHDKPYIYEMPVKNNQEIVLEIKTGYYNYPDDKFLDILMKLGKPSFEKIMSLLFTEIRKTCEKQTIK